MSRIRRECPYSDPPDRSLAADVLLPQEPDEEEDEEEQDEDEHDSGEDEDGDEGYSE